MKKPVQANMNGGVSGSIALLTYTGILMSSVMQGKDWWLVFVFISGKRPFLIPSLSPFSFSSHTACQALLSDVLGTPPRQQENCRAVPGCKLFSPILFSWMLPGSAKQNKCLHFSPSLCISLYLKFSHFGKRN